MRPLFLACSLFVATLSPSYAAIVNIVPSANVVGVASNFSVLVSAADFPETDGTTLGLRFNPNVVQLSGLSLAAGSPLEEILWSAFDNTLGQVEFISVLAPLEGGLVSGNFDVFQMSFRSVGTGAANIELIDDGLLRGWAGMESPTLLAGITYNQANVAVAVVPLPAAAWLLLSGLGVLLTTVRRERASTSLTAVAA